MQKKAVELLNAIWVNIDFENMPKSRLKKFQNEFVSKVRGCVVSSPTLESFVEALCKKIEHNFVCERADNNSRDHRT